MATSGANLRHFLPPDIWRVRWVASSLAHFGDLVEGRKNVHPEHFADGDTDAGDWSFCLRLNGDPRTAAVTADAHFGRRAAIGGEVPGAWVFVAEHVPERRIGIACGADRRADGGDSVGSVVATLVNTIALTQQAVGGWRIPFLLGAWWWRCCLRRWLQETPNLPRNAAA